MDVIHKTLWGLYHILISTVYSLIKLQISGIKEAIRILCKLQWIKQ